MDGEWVEEAPVQSQTFYSDQRNYRGNRNQNNGGYQRNDRYSSGGNKNWRDRNSHDSNYEQRGDNQKHTIKVPSRCVGRIIGIARKKYLIVMQKITCLLNF